MKMNKVSKYLDIQKYREELYKDKTNEDLKQMYEETKVKLCHFREIHKKENEKQMGLCYYFYKDIDVTKHWTEWQEIDSAKYCGIPDSIAEYGAIKIRPECKGCKYEENSRRDDCFSHIPCFECENDHTAYFITREQAQKIQDNMEYNSTLFTDMMDKVNQDHIYMKYVY